MMDYDPISLVHDEPLHVDDTVMENLKAFREKTKLADLPGVDPSNERRLCAGLLNDLADQLIQGIEGNPNKLWVLSRFQQPLAVITQEDTEVRDHFGIELEQLMDILGIESSDGVLGFYLGDV